MLSKTSQNEQKSWRLKSFSVKTKNLGITLAQNYGRWFINFGLCHKLTLL